MKLLPQKNIFFELFDQHADNLVAICEELRGMLHAFDRLPERRDRIKELEHRGDEITHELFRQMNLTFITPLDKEDIHAMASGLDDVVDYADAAGDRVALYQIPESMPEARALSDLLVESAKVLRGAVACLRTPSESARILTACREIHRLENESDTVYRRALGMLFNAPDADPILLLKWKEVYDRLEMAVDKCEDVANTVEAIQLKYG
jgi:predicted phosphate transport protein (TIGR00153 family)